MKKIIVFLICIVMTLSVAGCGNNKIEGTYTLAKVEKDGSTFTVEEMSVLGDDSFSDIYIILKDGGSAYYYEKGNGDLTTWEKTSDGVKIGLAECSIKDGYIVFDMYGALVYFEKSSDSQTIPSDNAETKDTSKEKETKTTKQSSTPIDYTGATIPTENNTDGKIEVVKEYFKIDNSRVTRYAVIKNISSMNIEVNSNTSTFDSSGNLSGAKTASIYALAPNEVGLLEEAYDKEGEVASITSNITAKELSRGTVPLTDFTYEQSIVGKKVVLQCEYSGNLESFDVVFNVLFFKDGEVVGDGWGMENFTPGVPLSVQIESWDDFDSVEVYPEGYAWE